MGSNNETTTPPATLEVKKGSTEVGPCHSVNILVLQSHLLCRTTASAPEMINKVVLGSLLPQLEGGPAEGSEEKATTPQARDPGRSVSGRICLAASLEASPTLGQASKWLILAALCALSTNGDYLDKIN